MSSILKSHFESKKKSLSDKSVEESEEGSLNLSLNQDDSAVFIKVLILQDGHQYYFTIYNITI